MSTQRASIFGDDDLDLSGFAPKPGPDSAAPPPAQVRAVAEAAEGGAARPVIASIRIGPAAGCRAC